jgi:hypothetical protein
MAFTNDRSASRANGANQCGAISNSMWKAQLRGWSYVPDGAKKPVATMRRRNSATSLDRSVSRIR